MSETSARYGWQSDLPAFVQASPAAIESALLKFLHGASNQQITSWHDSIRCLQREYVGYPAYPPPYRAGVSTVKAV